MTSLGKTSSREDPEIDETGQRGPAATGGQDPLELGEQIVWQLDARAVLPLHPTKARPYGKSLGVLERAARQRKVPDLGPERRYVAPQT